MNRKNEKKHIGFQLKKGLVLGLVLSLLMSLFSMNAVFAEEESETESGTVQEAVLQESGSEPDTEEEISGAVQEKPGEESKPVEEPAFEEPAKEPSTAEPEEEELTVSVTEESVSNEAKMQGTAEVQAQGNCGPDGSDSATWVLTTDGVLTISGKGTLGTYSGYKTTPWSAYRTSIKSLVVKKGITGITKYAFYKCFNLCSVSLPEDLLTLGTTAFKETAITSIVFPKSLTTIGTYVFEQTPLETVNLQNTNVTSIGRGAFSNCSELQSAVLNDSITSLPYVFNWDESLKTVVLGAAVTSLDGTFRGCSALNKVNLPASLLTIGWSAFGGCTSLNSLVLPAGLIEIGESAFQESGLTSVTLPSKLERIGKAAFYRTKLAAVTIPKSVKSIGRSAFPGSTKVTKLAAMTTMSDGSQKRSDLVVTIKPKVTAKQDTARKMLSLINSFRTGSEAWCYDENNNKVTISGLKKLSYDYSLEKIALQRAAEIALNFSHTRPDGSSCFELTVKDDAGNLVSGVAENIISGFSTQKKAMEGLKETSYLYDGQGHRRNMLSSDYSAVGIGHVIYEGKHFWVQVFGTTKSQTAKTTATTGSVTMSVKTWTESSQVNSLLVEGKPLKLGTGMTVSAPKATIIVRFAHGKYAGVKASKAVAWTKSTKTGVAMLTNGKVKGKKVGTSSLKGTVCAQSVKSKVTVLKTPGLPTLKKGKKSITVKWKKVKNASKYAVFRKTGSGKWKRIAITSSVKYVDKKVKRGKKYAYTIRCISKNKKTYESNYNKKGKKIKFK